MYGRLREQFVGRNGRSGAVGTLEILGYWRIPRCSPKSVPQRSDRCFGGKLTEASLKPARARGTAFQPAALTKFQFLLQIFYLNH